MKQMRKALQQSSVGHAREDRYGANPNGHHRKQD
jgi:hypothetical protein